MTKTYKILFHISIILCISILFLKLTDINNIAIFESSLNNPFNYKEFIYNGLLKLIGILFIIISRDKPNEVNFQIKNIILLLIGDLCFLITTRW